MPVYYGVVRHNHIELDGDTRLAEGIRVEVRPHSIGDIAMDDEGVKAQLRAAGLLAPAPVADTLESDDDFDPVVVRGEPLSEQLIRERR